MTIRLPLAPPGARAAFAVFVIALAIRIGYLAFAYGVHGHAGVVAEDSHGLLAAAGDLAAGRTTLGFATRDAFDPSVMPLTIVVMAAAGAEPDQAIGYLLLQTVVDSLTCLLIGLLAAAINPAWFLLAGLTAALNPTQIVLAGTVLTDTPFLFFTTAALLMLIRAVQNTNRRTGNAVLLGLALGGAVLTRTAIAPWIPVALTLLLLFELRRTRFLRAIMRSGLCAGLVLLLMVPILYRNHAHYGAWAITPQGGAHALFWVVPLVADFSGVGGRAATAAAARVRLDERLDSAAGPLDTFEEDRIARQLAMDMLLEFGPVNIGLAWAVGGTLNMGLPAASIAPPVRLLPHDSFYDAPGDGALDKIASYLTAPDNRLYATVVAVSALGVLIWLFLLAAGLWAIWRRAPMCAVLFVLWGCYILALNGPVASPKYRLPLEAPWAVAVAAALASRRDHIPSQSRWQGSGSRD